MRFSGKAQFCLDSIFQTDKIPLHARKIITIQTDNGSEFHGEFKKACKNFKINHCFAYPKSPQQNALVERSHRTDDDEFYLLGNWETA